MRTLIQFFPLLLLPFAACSGGSASDVNSRTGSVYVVVDTATGTETLAQFQVAAAVLEKGDGTSTGNLLATSQMLTLADPSGELDGLALLGVPTGEYAVLHLMLVPGSGVALLGNGSVVPIQSSVDLAVPIAAGLQHSSLANSWLVIGHNGAPPPTTDTDPTTWTPSMSGRDDGSDHEVEVLVANLEPKGVAGTLPCADDGILCVEFATDCTFGDTGNGDSAADRDDFLRRLSVDDELRVSGELRRDGRCVARHARRGRGHDGPRLIGRITELRPENESFLMDVQAEVRRGGRRLLPRETVLVLTAEARLHRPNCRVELVFADLRVGNLAKVKFTSRTPVPGGPDEVLAREIEVPAAGVPMRPEWQGSVQSVSVETRTIVVVPRHDEPIVIAGVEVEQATLQVGVDTPIQRREGHGGGTTRIDLGDIVPGQDRIWWRGIVTGPTTIAATWVRVRAE